MGIILIVAETIACGGKDTASEKDRIKEIEVYDDDNEPVTIQENEIVNTEFYELQAINSVLHKEREVYEMRTGRNFSALEKNI